MIAFTLPVDPLTVQTGGKRLVIIGGKPRFFKTKKVSSWEKAVGLIANRYRPPEPFSCPVVLQANFILRRPQRLNSKRHPDGRVVAPLRPDLDNLVKGLQDALKGFWADDSQVVDLHVRKYYAAKGEDAKIEVNINVVKEIE